MQNLSFHWYFVLFSKCTSSSCGFKKHLPGEPSLIYWWTGWICRGAETASLRSLPAGVPVLKHGDVALLSTLSPFPAGDSRISGTSLCSSGGNCKKPVLNKCLHYFLCKGRIPPLILPQICWSQWWLQCGICHSWTFCSRLKYVVRYIAEAALLRVWYWDVTDVLGGEKKLVERVAEEAQESCRRYLLRLLRASKLPEGVQHTTLSPGTGANVTVSGEEMTG